MKLGLKNPAIEEHRPGREADQTLATLNPEPPKEFIEKALTSYAEMQLEGFAGALQTARDLWRSHRGLVEARLMPAHLKALRGVQEDLRRFPRGIYYGPTTMAEARERLMADPGWREMILATARQLAGEGSLESPTEFRAKDNAPENEAEKPEWLDTPREVRESYELVMNEHEEGGEQLQDVTLTRQEYIALKDQLAKLRGIALKAA